MKRQILNSIGRRTLWLGLIAATFNIAAAAQDKKVELSASVAHTFATGFDVNPVFIGGLAINNIGMDGGFSYNFQGDYLIGENLGFGFLFSRQKSRLTARGFTSGNAPRTATIAEMPTYNYQFPLTYNLFTSDAKIRPFVFGGLGWTQFSPGTSQVNVPGTSAPIDLDNKSKFAFTLGGGAKLFLTESFGIKGTARWTPTHVNSQTEGVWCNYYYCAADINYKFSNQGEFSAGLFVRF